MSGKVTFKGQPVVAGKVYFNPMKGTSSPQGFAKITNGTYDTSADKNRGVTAGDFQARIEGRDAEGGALIFIFTSPNNMPIKISGTVNQDFEVPPSAADNAPKASTEPPP